MSQTVTTSGIGEIAGQSRVFVTYDRPQLGYDKLLGGSDDIIPGLLYVGGTVQLRKDSQGNLIAANLRADGTYPT